MYTQLFMEMSAFTGFYGVTFSFLLPPPEKGSIIPTKNESLVRYYAHRSLNLPGSPKIFTWDSTLDILPKSFTEAVCDTYTVYV